MGDKDVPSVPAIEDFDHVYQLAFSASRPPSDSQQSGQIVRPPIRIVDTGDPTRGNIAISTRSIAKGEVIFTEKCTAAALLPSHVDERDKDETEESTTNQSKESLCLPDPNWKWIRACRHCFKSLEPASSCTIVAAKSEAAVIPLAHLWPNPSDESLSTALHAPPVSKYFGIRKCFDCHNAWFCSQYCLEQHETQIGSPHCRLITVEQEFFKVNGSVSAPLLLAARLFATELNRLREDELDRDIKEYNQSGSLLEGLCGESKDLHPLELGVLLADGTEINDDQHARASKYTLQPFYDCLAREFDMTAEEQATLSKDVLEHLTAQSARNSVGFRTQSPFKTYFSALKRASGGWGTPRYEANRRDLALALVGKEELPGRGSNTDRELDDQLAPPLAALFSLTARLNHSCQPNAQLEAQAFVDCHVDVVAIQNIRPGEEITISYLGPVRSSTPTARRRRELRAKYLFDCRCPMCSNS